MNSSSFKRLFSGNSLQDYLSKRLQFTLNRIDEHDPDEFLNTSKVDLEEYYYSNYKVDPIELHESHIVADVEDVKIDVSNDTRRYIRDRSEPFYIPGTATSIEIPYTGIKELFFMQASTYSVSAPVAKVTNEKIIFRIAEQNLSSEEVKKRFNSWLTQVKKNLSYSVKDIRSYNKTLSSQVKQKIEHRRKKLPSDRELENSLGFPLKKRKGTNTFVTDKVKRKKIKPTLPKSSGKAYEPEPTITPKDYEMILDIIDKTATMLERNPTTFKDMDEEQLRDQFLVPLNYQFEGQTTGETFNAAGKTDILIREDDKCLFVAECKIWRGPKYFEESIDQLLSYTTWRDTKTAILIFNRNKNFTPILEKIPYSVKDHSSFKKELDSEKENFFRYIIAKESDRNRDVYLTVMAFDLPK